jgi:peptidoglycan/xylan/chitin deacetylase (PgdA/CDA1 family)
VLVRDDVRGELVLKSDALSACTLKLPVGLVDEPGNFRWRTQHRLAPTGAWIDVGPYLAMPWQPPADRAIPLEWSDRGAAAYRVVVRDDNVDEIIIKDPVPGTDWVLDCARLDPAHRHRYKIQTLTDEKWVDAEPYRPLRLPRPARLAVREPPGELRLDIGEQILFFFTVDTEAGMRLMRVPIQDRAVDECVFGRFGDGGAYGVDLHMDLLEKYGFRGSFFLDILMEHQYGQAKVEEAVQAIQSRGHELQLHLHPSHLLAAPDPELRQLTSALWDDDADSFRRVMALAVDLFERRVGRPPVAYRSGGYNLCDAFLDVLPEFGISIDASLFAYKNCRVSPWMLTRTQPFRVGRLLEIPVSWMIRDSEGSFATRQMGPFKASDQATFAELEVEGRQAPFALTYVSHSYALMESSRYDDEETHARWHEDLDRFNPRHVYSRLHTSKRQFEFLEPRPDQARLAILEDTLEALAARPEVRGVTFEEVHEAGPERVVTHADPLGDPVPVWHQDARAVSMTGTQTYSRSYLDHLESASSPPAGQPAGGEAEPLERLLASTGLQKPGARVLEVEDIGDAGGVELDAIVCANSLHLVPANRLLDDLKSCHERLAPRGVLVLRTSTVFSDTGSGAATTFTTPLPHLVFGVRAVREHAADRGVGFDPSNMLCAASYLALFRRAGFEFVHVRRIRASDERRERLRDLSGPLRFYDQEELETVGLEVVLRRPDRTPVADLALVEAAS